MKEIAMKSLKNTKIVTLILAFICLTLLSFDIVQNIQFNKMLKQQTEKYTELMIIQQPDIQEFPNRKLGRFTLTWYSPKELGKEKPSQLRTSTGVVPREGRTIAVDPKIIPYGSIVYIQDYGYYIAEDCGGDIKSNRIDIFTSDHKTAIQRGKKVSNVWILGKI